MQSLKDLKYKYRSLNVAGKIIVINVVVFALGYVLPGLIKYAVLPANLWYFFTKPWTLISYSFIHADIWHLLFNMLFLYYLSRVILNLFKDSFLLNVYFLGIICGGFLFMLVANVFPKQATINFSNLRGASAGVAALLMFVATYMPYSQVKLFNTFTVKWQHIAYFFITIDVLRLVMGINKGGYVSHLGGYALGYYYATQLHKGNNIGSGFERFINWLNGFFKPKSKNTLRTVYRKKDGKFSSRTKKKYSEDTQQEQIDTILDKISKSGYESLTKAEKEFLFNVGKD